MLQRKIFRKRFTGISDASLLCRNHYQQVIQNRNEIHAEGQYLLHTEPCNPLSVIAPLQKLLIHAKPRMVTILTAFSRNTMAASSLPSLFPVPHSQHLCSKLFCRQGVGSWCLGYETLGSAIDTGRTVING